MKSEIKFFGFELEAEFDCSTVTTWGSENWGRFTGDGSINLCENVDYDEAENCRIGPDIRPMPIEFVSPVISALDESEYLSFLKFLEAEWERRALCFNRTMGFHIHVSFSPQLPAEIWSLEFVKFFQKKMEERFPKEYNKRIENDYCKKISNLKTIIQQNRYREINFRSAYRKHGTIEFRVFPADEPKKLKQYIESTMEWINEFIDNTGYKEKEKTLLYKRKLVRWDETPLEVCWSTEVPKELKEEFIQ